ncbi:TrmH family RNA methyltransferase [Mesorhizobium xinjiangense]|uniref:TrmH family RNA methyltransferase n=1 Tax=Mesorhizobium xinjiangense TaxID=2678685 RepID=UPI001F40D34E|nr:RNA methyltransferase [Mesorhizobium xinjiangense]
MRPLITITDPGDPRLAAYRDIRERDLVGRQGRFIAEGKVVLNVLFRQNRFATESILLLENRVAGAMELIEPAPDDVPVYSVSAEVMDSLAGFHVHRGVLAVGLRHTDEDPAALLDTLGENPLVVVPVGITNHDNVGAIFRNAAAFEADAVLLDETCCDPLYRKAIRVSVGAALKVPFARQGTADDLVDMLDGRGFAQYALTPRGEHDIATITRRGPTALYLGSEGPGLPPSLMTRLKTVRIGMSESFDSLNVASASAIALHRLWPG